MIRSSRRVVRRASLDQRYKTALAWLMDDVLTILWRREGRHDNADTANDVNVNGAG